MKPRSRRDFIKTTMAGAAGIGLTQNSIAAELLIPVARSPIHIFTKCLQFLNYDEMAATVAEMGFDGADLTVRPGGQVLPENVKTDLPKAMKALRQAGVTSQMIATGINNPEDPLTYAILETMADEGIKYYRMGYLDYDTKKSIPENLDIHKTIFEKLENLNRKFGVCGNYQNHSGTKVGGPVWDLYDLLKERNPEYIGVQYDIRHATVEGGFSWPLGMRLLAPWIRTTDIKDFVWSKNPKEKWQIKNVPLGEGTVDFDKYFTLYKILNIKAPASIHYEYDLGGAEHGKLHPTMARASINSFLKKDITFLKEQFKKFDL